MKGLRKQDKSAQSSPLALATSVPPLRSLPLHPCPRPPFSFPTKQAERWMTTA